MTTSKALVKRLRTISAVLSAWLLSVATIWGIVYLFKWPARLPILAAAAWLPACAIFAFCSQYRKLYVAGHELTHWLVAKLFRRYTGRLRIFQHHGSLLVGRVNIWIALAPYFVPFYALCWCILSLPLLFHSSGAAIREVGIGVSYAQHWVLTCVILRRDLSDLKCFGRMLSWSVILCMNLLALLGVLLLPRIDQTLIELFRD
ncbi:MAG TPA: hypothetical protein DCR55_06235 [Lentisphaeria bacterium]|jgi:hypothetical protein|nr:hypothetical protein [Lentisphaeria bacterium]